jgi:hypothetical protein
MGEGNMGMEDYLRTYIQKCPGKAVSLEVIVSGQPRMFNYRDPKFWDNYRNTPAWEFSRFLALCDKGQPILEPPLIPRSRRPSGNWPTWKRASSGRRRSSRTVNG